MDGDITLERQEDGLYKATLRIPSDGGPMTNGIVMDIERDMMTVLQRRLGAEGRSHLLNPGIAVEINYFSDAMEIVAVGTIKC